MLTVVNLYLFWGTCQDIKSKKIRNEYLWAGAFIGLIYKGMQLFYNNGSVSDWVLAMIPGILILIIAKYTNEKIGFGDGWLLLILGSFFKIREIWYILQVAIFLVTIFSLILVVGKKADKEDQIPFLPFLWIAYLILRGLQYV